MAYNTKNVLVNCAIAAIGALVGYYFGFVHLSFSEAREWKLSCMAENARINKFGFDGYISGKPEIARWALQQQLNAIEELRLRNCNGAVTVDLDFELVKVNGRLSKILSELGDSEGAKVASDKALLIFNSHKKNATAPMDLEGLRKFIKTNDEFQMASPPVATATTEEDPN